MDIAQCIDFIGFFRNQSPEITVGEMKQLTSPDQKSSNLIADQLFRPTHQVKPLFIKHLRALNVHHDRKLEKNRFNTEISLIR